MTLTTMRLQWMDFLRGLAVLLVVVLHANEHGGVSVGWWTDANQYLSPFRMPLLMFLSGMLLYRSLAKPLPVYFWGKTVTILWPLVLWLSLYGLLARDGLGLPMDIWTFLVSGDYLWFLMALLSCYVLAAGFKPLAARLPETHHWGFLVVFVILVLLCVLPSTSGALPVQTLWHGSFFFLGAWAQRFMRRWVEIPWMAFLPLLALVTVFSYLGMQKNELRLGTPGAAALSVLGIAVFIWLAPRIPDSAFTRFVAWCGQGSIVVYVAHFPVIILLRDYVLPQTELSPAAQLILLTTSALGISVLFVWVRPWTPWLYAMPWNRPMGFLSHSARRSKAGRIRGPRQP
ncbi:acyltransferase family protein [Zhihengliuella halotolerans]|uniref:acyltransferase family protein n=1 Tax=Zhihengliuella halotolerans TaxID=370736 RepID=UPI0015E0958B|nr:acyltransferase [Zhihengliuella halotolerans]